MTDEIFFDGIRYISAGDAASSAGFTRDYVARLSKQGKVIGRRIGKQWYVSEDSLKEFVADQAESRARRAQELVESRKMEYQANAATYSHIEPEISHAAPRVIEETVTKLPSESAGWSTKVPAFGVSVPAKKHVYSLAPGVELTHKLLAMIVTAVFAVGTLAIAENQYTRIAARAASEHLTLGESARTQLAAVAANPTSLFGDAFQNIARSINSGIDHLFFTAVYHPSETADIPVPSSPTVTVNVTPQTPATTTEAVPSPAQSFTATQTSPSKPLTQTIINQPVIERVVETQRIITEGGITEALLDSRLQQLNNKLSSQISALTAQGSANSAAVSQTYQVIAQSTKIDQLTNTHINTPIISGGSISGASISGASISGSDLTISGNVSLGAATSTSLAVTGTGTSTFAGGVQATALDITSTSASSTFANGIVINGGCVSVNGACLGSAQVAGSDTQIQFNNAGSLGGSSSLTFSSATNKLTVPNASTTLLTVATSIYGAGLSTCSGTTNKLLYNSSTGQFSCGTDLQGSGGASAFATSTDNLLVYPSSTSYVVAIGASATSTTGNILEVVGNSLFRGSVTTHGSETASSFTATSTTATSQFTRASTTLLSAYNGLFVGGSATTSIYGSATSTFGAGVSASALNITSSSASSTFANGIIISGGCVSVNGACLGSSNVSLSAANTWNALQIFASGFVASASSTISSGLFSANGGASTTNLTASGTGYFATASTTNLTVSGARSGLLATDATGVVTASTTIGLNFGGTGATTAANARTNLGAAANGANSDITSLAGLTTALTVAQGGTGSTTLSGVLKGNGTGGIQSAVAGTDYENALTFNSGLTRSTNTVTLDMTNANTWSALQKFNFASSTLFSVYNGLFVGGGATTSIYGNATSTFGAGIAATSLNVTSATASSTFANGIILTGGCIAVNGACLGSSNVSLSVANAWSALQTFQSGFVSQASSTVVGLFTSTNASTTNLTATTGYFATASTTNLTVSGARSGLLATDATGVVTASTTLAVNVGGTGSTTLSGVLKGNGTGGIQSAVAGTDYENALTFNSGVTRSTNTVTLDMTNANTWSALQKFNFASSTLFSVYNGLFVGGSATTSIYGNATSTFGAGIAGTFLNITGTGATSTFASGLNITGGCFSINGSCVGGSGGGSGTVTSVATDGTLTGGTITTTGTLSLNLANANSWSALQVFAKASSTLASVISALYVGDSSTTTIKGSATSTFGAGIQTTALNVTSATASSTFANGIIISGGCLSVNGACLTSGGGGGTSAWPFTPSSYAGQAAQSTSTTLWFTGSPLSLAASSTFFTQASTTLFTNSGNSYFTNLASALLAVDNTGKLVSTTTIGTNLLSANAVTVTAGSGLTGGGNVALGGTITLTNPWNWSLISNFGTNTNATTTPTWYQSGLFASSTSQFVYASSTAFSISGTGFFGTASTTNLTVSGSPSGVLTTGLTGVVTASSTLAASVGGTGNTSYSVGDILYASASNVLTRLAVGSAGQVLKVSAGIPGWGADNTASGGASIFATTTDSLAIYPSTVGNVFLLGQSATTTTGNILEVLGDSLFRGNLISYNRLTAPSFNATSSTASSFIQASSTRFSVFDKAYFGGSATSSFDSTGALSLATALTVGNGGTGATTLTGVLKGNGTSAFTAATAGTDYVAPGTATTFTALQQFQGGASTTAFSAYNGVFVGGSATTSIYGSATSTFGAGVSATALNVTSATASSTFANGITLSGGCFAYNGACLTQNVGTVTSVSAGNGLSGGPITSSGSLAIDFTRANTWTGLQLFSGGASSTNQSVFGTLYVGGSSTTTITSSAINIPTGGAYQINGTSVLNGTTLGTGILTSSLTTVGALDSGSITSNFGAINIGADALTAGAGSFSSLTNSGTFSVTGLSTLGQASTTLFSAYNGVFVGGGATTSIYGNATSTFGAGIAGTYLNITGTTASSTFGNGINLAAGCFAIAGNCLSLGSFSGTLGVANGGTGQTSFTSGNLLYGSGTNGVSNVATSSLTNGGVISLTGTAGALVGGTALTITTAPGTFAGSGTYTFSHSTSAATGTPLALINPNSATTTSTQLKFQQNDLSTATTSAAITSLLDQNFNGGKGSLLFSTLQSGTLTEAARFTGVGNFGIGTSSPGSLLSLNNIANFTTATSTFYGTGGVNLAAGCFAIAGNCLSLGSFSGTLGVANGGTGATTLTGVLKGNGTSAFTAATAGTDYVAPGTATTFTALQQFQGGASTTALSAYNGLFVGGSATTSIYGSATSTFGAGVSATALNITSATASSTFANGITLSGGCFAYNGACLTQNPGTVTSITAGSGLSGGTITGSGTISLVWPWSVLTNYGTTTNATTTASWFQQGLFASSTSQFVNASTSLLSVGSGTFIQSSATSTFGAGIAGTYLNLTGTTASSTFGNGINLAAGCFAIAGNCLSLGTLSGTLANSQLTNSSVTVTAGSGLSGGGAVSLGGTISLSTPWVWNLLTNYGTTTNATTTVAWFQQGLHASSTSQFVNASTTNLAVSGTGYFATASTTNLTISGIQNGILSTNGTGVVSASTTIGLNVGGTGATTAAGARTMLGAAASGANSDITSLTGLTSVTSLTYASTSLFSVFNKAYFGGSATTTIDSSGNVVIVSGASLTGAVHYGGSAAGSTLTLQSTSGVGTSDYIALATGSGSERARIASGGNFSINGGNTASTSPSQTLSVTGNIYGTGTLGIGLSAPSISGKAEISDASAATTTALVLSNYQSATSTATRLTFRTNDVTGATSTASIMSVLQQNFNGGKGDLAFSVLSSGTLTEAMRLTGSGYLGIGTTTPYRRLSVTDSGNSAPQLVLSGGTGGDAQFMVDNSLGYLEVHASGNNILLNHDNLWVCTGGSGVTNGCATGVGLPTGQGNLAVENRFGIGTSTLGTAGANYFFTLDRNDGFDSSSNLFQISTSTSGYGSVAGVLTIPSNGYVGIASSTPFARLSIGSGGAITTTEASSTFNSGTLTVNWLNGNQQKVMLNASVSTMTFTNYIPGQILRLILCQGGSGTNTVTWPTVIWASHTAPTLSTTAGMCDVTTFFATGATSTTNTAAIFGASATGF